MKRPPAYLLWLSLLLALLSLWGSGLSAAAQTSGENAPSAASVRSELHDILNKPEFQPESVKPPPFAEQFEQMRARLEEWWRQFTRWLDHLFKRGGGSGFGTVSTTLVYVLIAVLAVAALWALFRILSERRAAPRPKAAVQKPTVVQAEADQELEPPPHWIAEANRFAEQGDFRMALRAVFMAILIHLDRAGKIKYARSRTNGDYLRLLRAANLRALVDLLMPVARDFDLHWYGHRPTGPSDYQRSLEAYRALPALTAAPGTGDAATSHPSPPGPAGSGASATTERE